MRSLQIEFSPIGSLKVNPRNARTHSDKQVHQIARSIETFGFNNPVLIDASGMVIAGHGRWEAARQLGMTEVPTVRLEHLSPAQKRGYVLADNKLAELAGWDREILAMELQHLLEADIDFELTDTGFDVAEIDLLLTPEEEEKPDAADDVSPFIGGASVTKCGDLWLIGPHRLLCADALAASSYEALLGGERAEMVFTDPPYNVPIDGHVSGLGKVRHEEFAMASGEMSEAEFTRFLTSFMRHLVGATKDGSIHFICMDWRHIGELLRAGRIVYSEIKNLCVWAKANGGMGSLYRSQHELIGVFKSGTAPHINNVELGKHGRNRTNVWTYAGMNSFQADRDEKLAMHPTVKPVAMVADAMLDCSRRRGIILDPFAGSGTTIVAAHRVGRKAYTMELDEHYVDTALRRARAVCGIEPVLERTGQFFSELERVSNSAAAEELFIPVKEKNHGR